MSLVTQGRQDILEVLAERGIESVILDEQATKLGGVETWQDAKKCAALFDEHRHRIQRYPGGAAQLSATKRVWRTRLSFPG